VRDALVRLRLVAAHPQQLRRREPGERAVAGERDEPVEPERRLDLLALRARAPVVPEDGGPDDVVGGVERDEPVHLTGQPDAGGVVAAQLGEHVLRRAPPVLGILLGPARPGDGQRIRRLGDGEDLALGGDRDALDRRGADVEADERGHRRILPMRDPPRQ
jgi:hypothetical protein